MNLLLIAAIVLMIVMISRDPKKTCRPSRHKTAAPDLRQLDDLTHRVNVLEEILLDRERRLRDKFGDL